MLEQTIFNALLLGMTYVLVASGLTLVFGIMGIFNFAHGEFYMIGGFAGYFFLQMLGINFFLALVLTMVGMFMFGWLIERYTFRLLRGKMVASMIISLGLSMVLSGSVSLLITPEDISVPSPFPELLHIGGTVLAVERLIVIILCIIIMAAMFIYLKRSKMGRAMRAVQVDPEAATLQGISIN
jgi:branched-chain amino acid transport system permease protein